MTYETLDLWSRLFDLLANRVSMINIALGARYGHAPESACKIVYKRGCYTCEVCGEPFATFRIYDVDALEEAYRAVDILKHGVWLLGRSGRLSFT